MTLHKTALIVFTFFFLLVTVAGFWAARWRRPDAGLHTLEEWGLAGRSFGTWITWFLMGGDLYTAYTVIAVPAALYGGGAIGFFAVPYAVIAYPYMMVVMPRLWRVSNAHGYVTFADFVRGRYGNRWLAGAIALTGILALMPYIALQLVGMRVVFVAMGLENHSEAALIIAFIILATYTYSSGLRAPAVIAIVKDVMLYIMVIAAVVILPIKLGGYGHIFAVANQVLSDPAHKPGPASIFLNHKQFPPVLHHGHRLRHRPHALPAYSHSHPQCQGRKRKSVATPLSSPAYSFLLGLIALLGYIAIAAGISTKDPQAAIPALFLKEFPEWFAGFCFAAIAVGALVPAANHVHRRRQPLHPQHPRRVPPHPDVRQRRIHRRQAHLAHHQVRRPGLHPHHQNHLRHPDAAPRRHLDGPALPFGCHRCLHPLVQPLGPPLRMGRRHVLGHSDGRRAPTQILRLPTTPLRLDPTPCTPPSPPFCST